jgi:amino acid transporter
MAEETREAGVVVPRSIWWSFVVNILPTLIVLVTYVFCIGDLDTTLSAPTGYPVVSVFQQSTGNAGATALTIVMLIMIVIIETSLIASTVRQTFVSATFNEVVIPQLILSRRSPVTIMVFSKWLARVDERFRVPTNSVIFTVLFTLVMSLINIGSTTAFNAFLSVAVVALMATYTISIACIFVKRLRGEPLPPARWRLLRKSAGPNDVTGGLGQYGPPINAIALVYSVWAFFWGFWPLYSHPTAASVSIAHPSDYTPI